MKCKLWLVGGSPYAYRVSTAPKGVEGGRMLWLPSSQIKRIKSEPAQVGKWQESVFEIPDWMAEQRRLWSNKAQ